MELHSRNRKNPEACHYAVRNALEVVATRIPIQKVDEGGAWDFTIAAGRSETVANMILNGGSAANLIGIGSELAESRYVTIMTPQLIADDMGMVSQTRVPMNGEYIAEELMNLFAGHEAAREAARQLHQTVERLIAHITHLTDRQDELKRELAAVYNDKAVAEARVRQLESVVRILQDELYRTKGRTSKKVIGWIAAAFLAFAPELLGVHYEHELYKPIQDTIEVAQEVVVACGDAATVTVTGVVKH
jgi:hypothetical protein